MNYRPIQFLLVFFLFIGLAPFLEAQAAEPHFARRIVWRGGENALRYAVEIDRSVNGRYQNHAREFTTTLYFDVSLPLGEYRFRIIPHDILDRPAEGTRWFHFEVRQALAPETADAPAVAEFSFAENQQFQIIDVNEQVQENEKLEMRNEGQGNEVQGNEKLGIRYAVAEGLEGGGREQLTGRYNALGVSVGSTFADPLVIATVHGSFAPMRHLFIELGCDIGFVSVYEDVERFFYMYPFAHLGFFAPFREKGGFFIGAGGGYQIVSYTFPYGKAGEQVFGVNVTAGINLGNVFTISYTLRTDFGSASHKAAFGYTYRFK